MEGLLDSFASRPARALWIEIVGTTIRLGIIMSRPARALWIEIILTDTP